MNLKLHFKDSHVEYFPENLRNYGEEQDLTLKRDLLNEKSIKSNMPLQKYFKCKRVRYNKKIAAFLYSHGRPTLI